MTASTLAGVRRAPFTATRQASTTTTDYGNGSRAKNGLGNLAASSVDQLAAIVRNRLKRIQYRPQLIDGFLAQTGLTLETQPP